MKILIYWLPSEILLLACRVGRRPYIEKHWPIIFCLHSKGSLFTYTTFMMSPWQHPLGPWLAFISGLSTHTASYPHTHTGRSIHMGLVCFAAMVQRGTKTNYLQGHSRTSIPKNRSKIRDSFLIFLIIV